MFMLSYEPRRWTQDKRWGFQPPTRGEVVVRQERGQRRNKWRSGKSWRGGGGVREEEGNGGGRRERSPLGTGCMALKFNDYGLVGLCAVQKPLSLHLRISLQSVMFAHNVFMRHLLMCRSRGMKPEGLRGVETDK